MEPGRPVRPDLTVCLFGAPRAGVRAVQRSMEAIADDPGSGDRLRRPGSPDADRCSLVGKAHRSALDTGAHEGLNPFSPGSRVQGPGSRVQSPESRVQSPESRAQGSRSCFAGLPRGAPEGTPY